MADTGRQEEWETMSRSMNAGFLRRWSLQDPRSPVVAARPKAPKRSLTPRRTKTTAR